MGGRFAIFARYNGMAMILCDKIVTRYVHIIIWFFRDDGLGTSYSVR